MTASELVAIAKSLAPGVLHTVTSETGPLAERITGLEAKFASVRDGRDGAPGRDGKDAPEPDVEAIARRAADLIPVPKDGRDAEAPDLDAIAIRAAALIPAPKDGANGKDADPSLVLALKAEITALTAQLAASEQQTEALRREMPQLVATEVAKAMASIQLPKDGTSVTVADVAPLIAEEVRSAVAAIPTPKDGLNGKDGVGLAGLVVSKNNTVIATLSDGTMRELGPWPRDGMPGERGERGADGRDGKDGKDGVDGLGIDDFDMIQDHERQFTMRWANGDRVKEKSFTVPVAIYRGIWDRDRAYEVGDQTTYAGSQWIAKAESIGKQPGTNEGGPVWQLCVKKGNDGKVGPPGPKGIDARPTDVRRA